MKFPLISTVYQLAKNVKQYVEIKSISSGGGANNMQRSKLRRKSVRLGGEANNMKRSKLRKENIV
jgi:hypothetical protein